MVTHATTASTSSLPYTVINAFTTPATPLFRGNPAAVILLPSTALTTSELQRIATQLALPETAFLCPLRAENDQELLYSLRWFTPSV